MLVGGLLLALHEFCCERKIYPCNLPIFCCYRCCDISLDRHEYLFYALFIPKLLFIKFSKICTYNTVVESGRTVRDILQHVKGVEDLILKIDRLQNNKSA
jgi:hypothetical protein